MKRTQLFLTILIILLFCSASVFAQKADLRVRIYAPSTAYAGQQLGKSVRVIIKNYGKTTARNFSLDLVLSKNSSIPIKFANYSSHYTDNVLLRGGREFIKYLSPGKSINVTLNGPNTIPADTPSGYYFIGAVVDPGNKVSETSETNNVAVRRIRIKNSNSPVNKLPDLRVKNIKLINNCKIAVTVANIGERGVPSSYYNLPKAVGVQMYTDGKPWGGLILKGFDPRGYLKKPYSQATYIWFPGASNLNLTAGTHTIKVIVDNNNNLTEADENNNVLVRKVYCKRDNPNTSPKSFFLYFKDAYLVYEPSSKTLQIASQGNVLSYGSDWQVVKMKSYLYHLREKFWKGFFWKVNTSRKEVYLVKGGSFGHFGGTDTKLNIGVDVKGDSLSPIRFLLRFHNAHLVYITSSKTLQIIEGNKVLSYGTDWQKCQLKTYLFDLKQNIWKGFFWRINTSRKKVYRVENGSFCKIGGSYTGLNIGVKVTK